jgi:Fic family protein
MGIQQDVDEMNTLDLVAAMMARTLGDDTLEFLAWQCRLASEQQDSEDHRRVARILANFLDAEIRQLAKEAASK